MTATGLTGTSTATVTVTVTGTGTGTLTATIYYISPVTYSRTITATSYMNDGGNVSGTAINTVTATYISGTLTVTGTTTATGNVSAWVTGTGTNTLTVLANQTTASRTVLRTNTATGTGTGTVTYSQTQSGTSTVTNTLTNSWTETNTITQTLTQTQTDTLTQTQALTQTLTLTVTNTLTQTDTLTQTITPTATETLTGTSTVTQTLGGTRTQVVTETTTQTTTATSTATQTETPTNTATVTVTVTGTGTGTLTATIYYISPVTYSRTITATSYMNDGGNVSGTAVNTVTATYISGTLTVTGTTTATGNVSAWVTGTGTNTLTVLANQTTASKTVLRTNTATGTGTGTVTYSQTQTATSSATGTTTTTVTQTATGTVTDTNTLTYTSTGTTTVTSTATNTITDTVTTTMTSTSTVTSASDGGATDVPSDGEALTLTEVALRVLGFESTLDWTVVQGSITAPVASADVTQGFASLLVGGRGYVVLQSAKLANSAVGGGANFSCDIRLPTNQSNPYWYGSLQFFVDLPSLGLFSAFVGQVNLGQPLGVWQTVNVPVPGDILAKLRDSGAYDDLVVKIAMSVPEDAPAPYLLDNLQLCGGAGTNPAFCETQDDCHVAAIDPATGICQTRLANDVPCQTSNADILGFQDAGRWSVSSGITSTAPYGTQGAAALAVEGPINYTTLISAVLTSYGPELAAIVDSTSFLIDVLLPQQQANPDWFGTLQMFLTSESRAVFNQYLGQVELTGAPLNVFKTWQFEIPPNVTAALASGPFSDLRVTLALNVPSSSTGTYIIDNLRLKGTVKPVVECVTPLGGQGYRATFGYENSANTTVSLAAGLGNSLSPDPSDRGQPTDFEPGIHSTVFTTEFSGESLSWEILGQVATATASSPICPLAPTIAPIVKCVRALGSGQYEAVFGYENASGIVTIIPVSDENKMLPGSNKDGGQVTEFKSGSVEDAFSVQFGGSPISWMVSGNSATASSASLPCPANPALTPILEGIQMQAGGGFKAYFGYQNDSGVRVGVNVGADNKVLPNPNLSRGQPSVFEIGRHRYSFSVASNDGEPILWKLAGAVAEATSGSPGVPPIEVGTVETLGTEINVCREILQHVFTPPTFSTLPECHSRSALYCALQTDCCVTKAICLGLPHCVVGRVVEVTAAYWDEYFQFHCEFKNVYQEFLIAVTHNTGLPQFILPPLKTWLDIAMMSATPLKQEVKDIIRDLIQPDLDDQSAEFELIDLEWLIVRKNGWDTEIFTFEMNKSQTKVSMTLENMVVYNQGKEDLVDALNGAIPTPEEFRNGEGNPKLHVAVGNLIHELVHARQYRELGSDRFVEEWLTNIVGVGDSDEILDIPARAQKQKVRDRYPMAIWD